MSLKENDLKIAYSFLKIKSSGEIHIFEGHFDFENCVTKEHSICEKVSTTDKEIITIGSCVNENGVRIKCALIGRTVCGTCVSHLYQSY